MSNEVKTTNDIDKNLWNTLKNSLYPGASDEMIRLVLSRCKMENIDPLLKPFHIMPVFINGNKQDAVVPGIVRHRIAASRSGDYLGITAATFGPKIESPKLGVEYPEWCELTVKKITQGMVGEFSARQYWLDNCGTKKDGVLNSMWQKRIFGQLEKCTEAHALRKAFPELCGEYTAEEMEGKAFGDLNHKIKTVSEENLYAEKSLVTELMTLCENNYINAKEFADFHSISRKQPETIEKAIANFQNLKEQFIGGSNEQSANI